MLEYLPSLRRLATSVDSQVQSGGEAIRYPLPDTDRQPERLGEPDTIWSYLERLVNARYQGHLPEPFFLEDNIGVHLQGSHADGTIRQLSTEIFVAKQLRGFQSHLTNPDDSELPTGDIQYLRFDFEPEQPGRLFLEPVPHIHAQPQDAPRFGGRSKSPSPLADFFDFIYRNYRPDDWMAAVELTWEEYRPRKDKEIESDVFEPISEAYKEGKIDIIEENDRYRKSFELLKKCLREARQSVFSELEWPSDRLDLLNL